MGCAMNKHAGGHSDCSPQVFRVYNVDDRGHERTAGKIEINEHSLVLVQKGKEPLHWPLRSLRRYGFDAELFSFESGRRCPTGPGIYAFKCHRAEALFNLLQEFIVRAGQEEQRQSNPLDGSDSNTRPRSLVEVNSPGQETPSPRHEYMNGEIRRAQNQHEYVNTALSNHSPVSHAVDSGAVSLSMHQQHCMPPCKNSGRVIQYAELDLPRTGEDGASEEGASGPLPNGRYAFGAAAFGGGADDEEEESCHAMYINVPAAEIKRPSLASLQPQPQPRAPIDDPHNYANIGLLASGASRLAAPRLREPALPPLKVQYVQLDLKNSRENLNTTPAPVPNSPISVHSTPDSPQQCKTDSYALIDFDRTHALQARNVAEDEEGARKTRHNSNIDELN